MQNAENSKVSYTRVLLHGYCPKCRRGLLFKQPLSFSSKKNLAMVERCPSCEMVVEREPGFFYGTGYVSYAITIAISILTFCMFWLCVGFPFSSTATLISWIVANMALLFFMQPILMRLSRMIWLSWFYE